MSVSSNLANRKVPFFLNPVHPHFKILNTKIHREIIFHDRIVSIVIHHLAEITSFLSIKDRALYFTSAKCLNKIWLEMKKRYGDEYKELKHKLLDLANREKIDWDFVESCIRYKVYFIPSFDGIRFYPSNHQLNTNIIVYHGDAAILRGHPLSNGKYKQAFRVITFSGQVCCCLVYNLSSYEKKYVKINPKIALAKSNKRFIFQEFQIYQKVSGVPNFPATYACLYRPAFDQIGEFALCVQRLETGGSLNHVVQTSEFHKLPNKQLCQIVLKIFQALNFLHKNGIVHRDLALRNIVMNKDLTEPCLIDFGSSRLKNQMGTFLNFIKKPCPREPVEIALAALKADNLKANLHSNQFYYDIFKLGLTLANFLYSRIPVYLDKPSDKYYNLIVQQSGMGGNIFGFTKEELIKDPLKQLLCNMTQVCVTNRPNIAEVINRFSKLLSNE